MWFATPVARRASQKLLVLSLSKVHSMSKRSKCYLNVKYRHFSFLYNGVECRLCEHSFRICVHWILYILYYVSIHNLFHCFIRKETSCETIVFLSNFWNEDHVYCPPWSWSIPQCDACFEHYSYLGKQDAQDRLKHFEDHSIWSFRFLWTYFFHFPFDGTIWG